jgi:hypothetical protein
VRAFAAAAAVLALAAPAGALGDFVGTYEGKLRCRENAAGVLAKTKQDLRIELTSPALNLFAAQVFASEQVYAYRMEGYVVQQVAKPDRATLSAPTCDFSALSNNGVVMHAELTAKDDSDKAALKGTLLRLTGTGGSTSELCTFTAKRTSSADPVVSACPP